jgi:hypothetical protein
VSVEARPRSKWRKVVTSVLLAVAVLLAWEAIAVDGPLVLVLSRVYPSDTVFAPGYSEWGFWRVTRGDSREEVQALLGTPLRTEKAAADKLDPRVVEMWFYADSPSGSHHHQRIVMFSSAGRVSEVWSGYHVDSDAEARAGNGVQ